MKSATGQWGWCYLDHEASRWIDVELAYHASSDTVSVTERGSLRATLDRPRSVFHRADIVPPSGIAAPQELRAPEFPLPSRGP